MPFILNNHHFLKLKSRTNPFLDKINKTLNKNLDGYYFLSYDLTSKDYNYILILTNIDNISLILKILKKKWNLDLKIISNDYNIFYLNYK